MNTVTHTVEPEKIMAWVDGELSAANAQAVATHVEYCAECARVAEQLRSTSQALSAWRVPNVPSTVENFVAEFAARAASGLKIGRTSFFTRFTFWTWKQWAFASGGTLAALTLVLALSFPMLRHREGADTPQMGVSLVARATDRDTLVTRTSPGIIADSNGLFHGVGDHARNSFSVDGLPMADQQSKVFSNVTQGPMIARVVSLSIVVKNFATSRSALDTILARHHGYAAQLNASTPEDAARSLQASLRVPALELSAAISDLKSLGRVANETQSGEEVTFQHADLVARLKNTRETERRLSDILEQRTGKVSEVLEVEQEIARVRGEIEGMEAEQKTLEHRVDFATIELQLTEEYKAQLNPPAASLSTRMHNALVAGYQNVSETVFGVALFFAEYGPTVLLWLVILVLPVILIWRRYRGRLAAV